MTNNGVALPAVAVSATGAYTVPTTAPAAPGLDVITATFIPAAGSGFQPSPTAQVGGRALAVFVATLAATNLCGALAHPLGHAARPGMT